MKWLDRLLARSVKRGLESQKYEEEKDYKEARAIKMIGAQAMVERSRPEGENRITFELSSAVGGRILNVRHYDERKDRHDTQTYVIPSGDDVGERVAKIINLELFKQ